MINRAQITPEPPRVRFTPSYVGVIGLLILSFMLTLLVAAPLQAQSIATVRPNPAQLELLQGETAALEIRLENARDLYGIDVRLAFDPSLLEVVDADPNQSGVQMAPGSFPKPELIALNAADNAAGTARYVITQLNPTPPASGSGVVFTIQVRALAAGRTELAIPLVEMSDRDGNLLAVDTGSSAIEVRSNPAAATGIPLPPPSSGASGESAAPATPAATAAPTNAPANDAPPENPPPGGQTAPGATPIAPEATVEVGAGAGESGAVESEGSEAVVTGGEASETAVIAEVATETVSLQGETGAAEDEAASEAIGSAISSIQAGEAPAETAPEQPAAAPQVIGGSSNPASAAPEGEPAAESTGNRPSPGLVVAVVALLVLAGTALAIMRGRGRRTTGPTD